MVKTIGFYHVHSITPRWSWLGFDLILAKYEVLDKNGNLVATVDTIEKAELWIKLNDQG